MGDATSALGEAIAAAAKAQIGVTEWAEGSNPAVEAYWLEAGMEPHTDDVPWCAAFVGAILGQCGVKGTGKPNARSYLDWGVGVDYKDVQPGDVIVSWRGARDGWQGHVEIVTDRTSDGAIITVGGNESDAVRKAPYLKTRYLGARRARQPRKTAAQSKTVIASATQAATAVASGAGAVSALDGTAQIVAIVGCFVVLALAMFIMRERLKAWAGGWR